jgi:hypothetical protein
MIPKVREWLEKQGYSLEMRTASAFRAAGFDFVRQSSYYTDAETNKAREMDVEIISRSWAGFVDVRFFVECKSGDKPWVLLCSTDTLMNYNRLFAFCAMSEQSRSFFAQSEGLKERIEKFSWLKKDGVIAAYSLRQAFSGDADSAYTAAMNVTKACHYHVTGNKPSFKFLGFAFPVIVVDTPLIRGTLDASGEIELQEVGQAEFLFSGHEAGTCIRIVTLAHLPAFAREAKHVAQQLKDELSSEEDKIRTAIKQATEAKPSR